MWLKNQVVVGHLLWPFHTEINTHQCLVKGDKSFGHSIKVNFLVPLASYNFDHSIFYFFYIQSKHHHLHCVALWKVTNPLNILSKSTFLCLWQATTLTIQFSTCSIYKVTITICIVLPWERWQILWIFYQSQLSCASGKLQLWPFNFLLVLYIK